jgi:hypothetical protein
MSKLSRKAKLKEKKEEEGAKRTLVYLGIGLLVLAIILGIIFS